MKKISQIVTILFLLATGFLSCSKNDQASIPDENNNSLVGSWAPKEYIDLVTVYNKTNNLKADQYGYIFKPAGKLTMRSSASWCGTPMTYADYDGTWSLDDGILTINGKYWGGRLVEKWEMVAVSNRSFTAKRISTEFPE
jgi:hypothetical protein